MKQLEDDPWINVKSKFKVDDKVTGVVTNVTDYGIFIEIENGVRGSLSQRYAYMESKEELKTWQSLRKITNCRLSNT